MRPLGIEHHGVDGADVDVEALTCQLGKGICRPIEKDLKTYDIQLIDNDVFIRMEKNEINFFLLATYGNDWRNEYSWFNATPHYVPSIHLSSWTNLACLRKPMICSSVNLDFFIAAILRN